MSGILSIDKGSPQWWLSADIWVTLAGDPTTAPGVGNPVAGATYNVSVRVHDNYSDPVDSGWNLFVCWVIPTIGSIPIPPAAQILNKGAITVAVPPMSLVQLETATTWTPSFVNGGHECLIAMAYNEQAVGFPVTSLNGNAPDTATYSIAQKNLGVVQVGTHPKAPFHYAFQACNSANVEGKFVITAQQAPLSDIATFLPGMPGGRSIADKPGKIANLGITASGVAGSKAATAVLSSVPIAPHSCQPFTLSGVLEEGNALVHVTQSLDGRVVGGLSVLVLTE
jgi:hypothetical protein